MNTCNVLNLFSYCLFIFVGVINIQQQHAASLAQQPYGGSPQRRFLSEGELVRQGTGPPGTSGADLSYARSNNTVDNIRELAGSPQRGVYMWKDTSPGFQGSSGSGGIVGMMPPPSSIGGIGSSAGTMPSSMQHHNTGGPQYITVSGGAQQGHPLIMTHSRMHQTQPGIHDYQQQQQHSVFHRSNPTSPTTLPSASQGAPVSSYMLRYGNASSTASSSQPQSTSFSQGLGGGVSSNLTQSVVSTSQGYQPKIHGGVPVFPPNPQGMNSSNTQPSPQIKRKQTPTRPMSFVRALEMTDSMEMQTLEQQQQQQQHHQHQQQQQQSHLQQQQQHQGRNNGAITTGQGIAGHILGAARNNTTTPTPDRASVYDMNYEISV